VVLDGIDVAFYADGDARANALLSGDVDMIDYVTWENFGRIEEAGNLTLSAEPGPFQYVQFNVSDGPFANPLVRQAVAYAVNRDNALQAAFQSNGEPLTGVVMPENSVFQDLGKDLWEYDPDRAKELLAEAGYPDGFSATMLATSQYTFLQDTALSVQQDLKAVGIDVTLDAPDWSGRLEKGAAGDYDIAVSGDVGMISDPSYLLAYVQPPNNFNRSFNYDNPEIVAALGESLQATTDEERVAAVERAVELFGQDVPFAPINVRDQAWAFNSELQGFVNLPGFKTFWSSYSLATASLAG
jgi:glutathione transport system substrate-binding protein